MLASYTPGLDDQHVTGHLFVDRNEWFELDRHARLFQSMHGNADDVAMERAAASGAPALHNTRTGSHPLVLHFNGGAKDKFARMLDREDGCGSDDDDGEYHDARSPDAKRGKSGSREPSPSSRTDVPGAYGDGHDSDGIDAEAYADEW